MGTEWTKDLEMYIQDESQWQSNPTKDRYKSVEPWPQKNPYKIIGSKIETWNPDFELHKQDSILQTNRSKESEAAWEIQGWRLKSTGLEVVTKSPRTERGAIWESIK